MIIYTLPSSSLVTTSWVIKSLSHAKIYSVSAFLRCFYQCCKFLVQSTSGVCWVLSMLCLGWMTFAPELLTGGKNLVTDSWLYLWVYLVLFNGLWVVMPIALMYQSWLALTADPRRRKPSTASRRSESPKAQNLRNDAAAVAGGEQVKKRKTRRKQY